MKTFILFALALIWSNTLLANDELIKASIGGDLESVKKIVEGGADVNYKNASGQTALSVAYFSADITNYLLGKGADPNGGDYPALVSAAHYYSLEVINILLKAGADPNKVAIVKVDLNAAARKSLEDEKAKGKKANKTLIKIYEDMIKKNGDATTMSFSPLIEAVGWTNCKDCIEALLNAGAKPETKSPIAGGNALHELAQSYLPVSQREVRLQTNYPYLEQYGVKVPDWYKTLNLSTLGNVDDIIKLLKSKGVDMEAQDNNKWTPLKVAVTQPKVNAELVLALIDNGASVKATGMTNDPTEFQKETADAEKIKVKFDFPAEGRHSGGSGYSANMANVNPKPKKVALISFYLYDAGKGKTTGNASSATVTASVWRTPDAIAQTQIDGFYSKSIGALKASFKENGIDLLTPNEFLDSDEKADFYYGFSQESAKKEKTSITRAKVAGGFMGEAAIATVSTLKISPSEGGYRQFFIANEGEDESSMLNFQGGVLTSNRKLTSSLGFELAKGLGVDAVVVVYICTRQPKMTKQDFGVNAVVTMMLGPNPGRSETSDPEAKNLGQFYCGTRTYYSSPAIFKEADGIFGQYDGMANVLRAHTAKMCKYINGSEKDDD